MKHTQALGVKNNDTKSNVRSLNNNIIQEYKITILNYKIENVLRNKEHKTIFGKIKPEVLSHVGIQYLTQYSTEYASSMSSKLMNCKMEKYYLNIEHGVKE